MRKIDLIVVHCSASAFGNVELVRSWHTDPPPRGRGWQDIGYHYLVLNGRPITSKRYEEAMDGIVERGRPEEEAGAHCPEVNASSIGVCVIGNPAAGSPLALTVAQRRGLVGLLADLCRRHDFPSDAIHGHAEYPSAKAQGKTCPGFPLDELRAEVARRL